MLTRSVSCVFGVVLVGLLTSGAADSHREEFTAIALSAGGPRTSAVATRLDIVIERWSTDAERDRLTAALLEKGPDRLLGELQALPRVGYIRDPNSIGYDLHYARKAPGEDGGEHVVLATDRYITFWEAVNRPRTVDYPFTLIELHIGADGKGEGKMSIATKILYDKRSNSVILENYGTQPVRLANVRREDS